ncbi:hypothetical protein V1498_06340 [Peribacillus sp. SCS-26]|uniref:hypothetical protein n=1 Tax=Paraperibacillus marinus TaxID=3115295 RepID=UPI003905E798
MEQLIDFLFGNAAFLIVLIGLASTLFGRGGRKRQEEGQVNKPNASRPAGQMPRPVQKPVPAGAGRRQPEIESRNKPESAVYHDAILEEEIAATQLADSMKRKRQIAPVQQIPPLDQIETGKAGPFTEDQILNGVIMAEILGRPRSRNGRSTVRYRSLKS